MSKVADWCALNKLLDDFVGEERCQRYLIEAFCEIYEVSRIKVDKVLEAWGQDTASTVH